METTRIASLLAPFLESPLTESQLRQISIYIDLLLRWNARMNLTAIRREEDIVTRHFGESLFMARHLFPRQTSPADPPPHVLDIGSGAGFPGLPLKLWSPEIHLTLLEANHKKATFLREVVRALTLTDVNIIAERAEALAARPGFPRADLVTLRAVEQFTTILPQARAFLLPQGRMALLITESQLRHLPPLNWTAPIHVPESQEKILTIGQVVD